MRVGGVEESDGRGVRVGGVEESDGRGVRVGDVEAPEAPTLCDALTEFTVS